MHLKYSLPAGVLAVCLCSPWLLPAASTTSQPAVDPHIRIIEEIVAKVNGEIITQTELEHQRELIGAELKRQNPTLMGEHLDAAIRQKQADALRDQIDQLLLVAQAKDLNINVDPEITRRIASIQADSKIADPEAFHKWVQDQAGVPFEDFRNQMKNQMLTQRVISQEVAYKIQVPQSELKDYYEKHKGDFMRQEQVFLREILIAPKSDSPADVAAAEKKAKDLVARARKGEKFSDLARSYSDAPTAQEEGQLPPYKKGDLRKEIEDVVFKANRGFITDPIRTTTGFVFFKVDDRYEAGQASFEDVKNEVMEKIYSPKMQPQIRKYLTQLRKDAFIEIRGGYVDSGAAEGKDTTWRDPATLKPETTTKEEVAARKRKRLLGVIPRGSAKVSSSDPGSAPKMPAATPSTSPTTTPAPTPAGSGSSSSSSSETPAVTPAPNQ
jgi:peptidyl-prolyl cis-trans isomerase SurA